MMKEGFCMKDTLKENPPTLEAWSKIMADWRQSGLSVTTWVEQQDTVTYHQFMQARKKYFREDIKQSEDAKNETEWSSLSIEIPSSTLDLFICDCRIEVSRGFDQELLRELIEVIRHED